MRVAIVSGPRSQQPMGLELAERRLLDALRSTPTDLRIDVRVVGRRRAFRHARALGGRWVPARTETLPRYASAGADLVHLIGLDLPPPRHKPFVATVHDLSPLHFDDEGKLPPWIDEVAARARLLLTPLEFTAREAHEHLGVPTERIRVSGGAPALEAREGGAALPRRARGAGESRRRSSFATGDTRSGRTFRCCSRRGRRCRSERSCWRGLRKSARARTLAEASSLERIVTLDYVPQELLARLLRTAAVLASPSTYEGFGLPPLEALAAGTPVVAADCGAIREVCADAALLVPPRASEFAAALARIKHDLSLAALLRERGLERAHGFTWDAAAHRVQNAYREAL